MKKSLLFLILTGFATALCGQRTIPDSLASLLINQLNAFPQEKIYLHTDKPYYTSGEKIWFRAYLADAITHVPGSASRYVYVELINPLDSLIARVKIRPDEEAYYGHLAIPAHLPEGDYTLRAYTTFMRSQEEHYFFRKTLRIVDPQARAIRVDTQFFFESDRQALVRFRFLQVGTLEPIVPQSVKMSWNKGRPMSLQVESDGTTSVNIDLVDNVLQKTLLLELTTDKTPYRQFIPVLMPDSDYELSFYPEGGALVAGATCKVAFKALQSNGVSVDVSGTVYDQSGVQVGAFSSDYLGMGCFLIEATKGARYHAVCTDSKGQTKRFDLPMAIDNGYALSVNRQKENIYVSVVKSPELVQNNDELYLFAHTRGMIHFIECWDHQKEWTTFSKELFPSGVLHLILFDAQCHPLSERLVFINNNDQGQVACHTDEENYVRRSLVTGHLSVTNTNGIPLTGSFSVTVTSDRDVAPDSTAHILTQLLLTSDLRGYIESPAFYFQNTAQSLWALDLLMCTQGWRRYDTDGWTQGHIMLPSFPVEMGAEVSGKVQSAALGRPVEGVEVTVAPLAHTGGFLHSALTDADGSFNLTLGELPDSTRYLVSVNPKRGVTRMDLRLHEESFPEKTLPVAPPPSTDKNRFAQYAGKSYLHYASEEDSRVTTLTEAVVTAERTPPKRSSQYYTHADETLTEEQLERIRPHDMVNLLRRFTGVAVQRTPQNEVFVVIRGVNTIEGKAGSKGMPSPPPLLVVDDTPVSFDLIDQIPLNDIAQIDILKNPINTSIFGVNGGFGVIVIHTQKGGSMNSQIASEPSHIKTLLPLGYQQPVEFYAPKYDTPEKRGTSTLDLRTTIHWQPVVQTDSFGTASFEFYTADESACYTLVIEGLADDGTIIRKDMKIDVL